MPDERSPETFISNRRIRWRGIAQILFGAGALALVCLKSDPRAFLDAIRTTQVVFLPLALLCSFAVTWLMAARWGLILGVRENRPSNTKLFGYYLVGIFFTNFIPGGGVSGDVARLIYVDREIQDKAFVLSTLVYERLVGVFILLLIGVGATLSNGLASASLASGHASGGALQNGRALGVGEAALLAGFLGSAALMSRRGARVLSKLVIGAGRRLGLERIAAGLARTLDAISRMRFHRGMMAGTVALSISIRVVWCFGCY